jgi:hypothetical protein
MISLVDSENIKVDDDASISTLSDVDVTEITRPILQRQESTGYCSHKLEISSSVSPTFQSDDHINSEPIVLDSSPSSIKAPKLRRERQSDYGMFNKHFEDDVLNWFHCIDKKKKIELVHTLIDMISCDEHIRNASYIDSPRPNVKSVYKRLGSQELFLDKEYDQDSSIKLDDIEDLS